MKNQFCIYVTYHFTGIFNDCFTLIAPLIGKISLLSFSFLSHSILQAVQWWTHWYWFGRDTLNICNTEHFFLSNTINFIGYEELRLSVRAAAGMTEVRLLCYNTYSEFHFFGGTLFPPKSWQILYAQTSFYHRSGQDTITLQVLRCFASIIW